MIVNENTDVIAELKKRKARRDKIPKTYTQLQYERAEAKQNKIKNHYAPFDKLSAPGV